jgi:hypothetical protein
MTKASKVLWVVNYDELGAFVDQAAGVGANAVAIRTDNDLSKAIPVFHRKGIEVFGWRWPSAKRDAAMKEAAKVAGLIAEGLDGYYVDPEGDPGKPWDWDQNGLESLADDFCSVIRKADLSKTFGTTSHYRAKRTFPKLPWASFFKHSTALLPQAYWRTSGGVVGHGLPEDNYQAGIDFWTEIGARQELIAPMAGELARVSSAEIDTYANAAGARGVRDLHFYAHEDGIKPAVWKAVARAG